MLSWPHFSWATLFTTARHGAVPSPAQTAAAAAVMGCPSPPVGACGEKVTSVGALLKG